MTIETTPLRGHETGEGWHVKPKRRWLLVGAVSLVCLLLLVATAGAVEEGNWPAVLIMLVFVVALGSIPLANQQRRLPARLVIDPTHGPGLLLPIHGMTRLFTFGLIVLGLLLLLAPVIAFDETDGSLAKRLLATVFALIPAAIGAFFLVAAGGAIFGSRRKDKGILLTPESLVLNTQAEPMTIPWDAVHAVRPHWTRFRPPTDLVRSAEDPVHNWLSFPSDPERVDGPNPLGAMARTEAPSMDADKLATDREGAVLVLRHYLDHPAARAELGGPSSLAHAERLLGHGTTHG